MDTIILHIMKPKWKPHDDITWQTLYTTSIRWFSVQLLWRQIVLFNRKLIFKKITHNRKTVTTILKRKVKVSHPNYSSFELFFFNFLKQLRETCPINRLIITQLLQVKEPKDNVILFGKGVGEVEKFCLLANIVFKHQNQ